MDPYEHIHDASRLSFDGEFDTQVDHIILNVRLTRAEVENMRYLVDDVERTLQALWPGCEVEPFGSIVTGLGIRTCDVDCYVSLPNGLQSKCENLMEASNQLKQYPNLFAELFAITSARVPIVKFLHVPTNIYCNVNFKGLAGVRNSQLLAFLFNLDQRALSLAVLIKYWSKIHKFTGTNLMTNYALSLLVLFYLQQIKILPPVHELQKNRGAFFVDNWNTAFEDYVHEPLDNKQTLCNITGGFFEYYDMFDFEEDIVSPYLGQPVNRHLFQDINNVPDEFSTYKYNVASNGCQALKVDTKLCIQDPFEHNRNCALAVYPKLISKMITYIRFAVRKYQEDNNNFLRAILTEVPHSESTVAEKPKVNLTSKVKKPNQNKLKVSNLNAWCEEIKKLKIGKR